MDNTLPSVPYEVFDAGVFTKILEIYARVAEIKNPCETSLDMCDRIPYILYGLSQGFGCEFRLGSILATHSKLSLHLVSKCGKQQIGFDLNANLIDGPNKKAVAMRNEFRKKIQEYFLTLPISVEKKD